MGIHQGHCTSTLKHSVLQMGSVPWAFRGPCHQTAVLENWVAHARSTDVARVVLSVSPCDGRRYSHHVALNFYVASLQCAVQPLIPTSLQCCIACLTVLHFG